MGQQRFQYAILCNLILCKLSSVVVLSTVSWLQLMFFVEDHGFRYLLSSLSGLLAGGTKLRKLTYLVTA